MNSHIVKPVKFAQFAAAAHEWGCTGCSTINPKTAMDNVKRPLRVLFVEDNPQDSELMVRELEQAGFATECLRVDTEADYLKSLTQEIDIVLSDYKMSQFDGLRALALLRERGMDLPFVMVAGTIGEETAVTAIKSGASDYLHKDRLTRLGSTVSAVLEESRLRKERKAADAALAAAEAKFRSIFENAVPGIYQSTPEYHFLIANPALAGICGYDSPAELTAAAPLVEQLFVDPERRAEFVAVLVERGKVTNFETELHRRGGGRVWVSLNARVVRNPEGRLLYDEVFVEDISRRREIEAQMLRAQRMECIGTLAGGLAHDLNNILSPILMTAHLLRRELPPERRESIISTIELSAMRGADIVRQVLTFAHGVEGARRPLQVGDLIGELVKIMGETFPKNITIVPSVDAGLWPVSGDATQIHQVLLNLCLNARDSMPDGGQLQLLASNIDLDVSHSTMLPAAKPGLYVLIEVADDGCGIPPEIQHRIFDPFFTTKGVESGTGLGLSTSRGIINSHGGFIDVASASGKGTTFKVYLPVVADEQGKPGPASADSEPSGGGEWVLVVDDEKSIRDAVKTVLELHNYQVLLAADGTEALAVFAQNADRIRAVLTDVTMPFMGGVALIRALQKMSPSVPVIASTGQGEKARISELKAMDLHGILTKPYGTAPLLQLLHDALHPKAAPATPP